MYIHKKKLNDYHSGFDTILEFSTFFYKNRERMSSFELIRYEDLHAYPIRELRRVLAFLDVHNVSDEVLKKAGLFDVVLFFLKKKTKYYRKVYFFVKKTNSIFISYFFIFFGKKNNS